MSAVLLSAAFALLAAGIGWWTVRRHAAARDADTLIMDIDDHPDDGPDLP